MMELISGVVVDVVATSLYDSWGFAHLLRRAVASAPVSDFRDQMVITIGQSKSCRASSFQM